MLRVRMAEHEGRTAGEIEDLIVGRCMVALRRRRLSKAPGVAETIDWAQALCHLHSEHLDRETVAETLGCILKDQHDLRELGAGELETVLAEVAEAVG